MSGSASSAMDRRRFLAVCAAGTCALPALVTGCASLATRPVTAVDGVVRFALADHPELARREGSVKILPTGERDPLFVLALGEERFAVLSTVCTHRGCTVDAQGAQLVCPCHGSTYDRSGAVLRGPAERALRRYRSRVVRGFIEIDLRESA